MSEGTEVPPNTGASAAPAPALTPYQKVKRVVKENYKKWLVLTGLIFAGFVIFFCGLHVFDTQNTKSTYTDEVLKLRFAEIDAKFLAVARATSDIRENQAMTVNAIPTNIAEAVTEACKPAVVVDGSKSKKSTKPKAKTHTEVKSGNEQVQQVYQGRSISYVNPVNGTTFTKIVSSDVEAKNWLIAQVLQCTADYKEQVRKVIEGPRGQTMSPEQKQNAINMAKCLDTRLIY